MEEKFELNLKICNEFRRSNFGFLEVYRNYYKKNQEKLDSARYLKVYSDSFQIYHFHVLISHGTCHVYIESIKLAEDIGDDVINN